MLRKFSKKNSSAKQSKRGVILVTIIFILAISFILITAAMLMTKGTRDRLYARAESSQARLTATAVAQSFYQAYWDQTLSDSTLSVILSSNRAGNPLQIYTTLQDLPGLTQDADNCTTLTVVPNPTNANDYYLDFKTTIGTESSTVRLSLKHQDHGSPNGTFQHQLQLGSGGRLENIVVGTTVNTSSETYDNSTIHRYNAENNTVLSLGNSTSWGGQTHIASTLYCDSALGSGSNTQMYGDVIFFGSGSGLNLNGLSGSSFHGNDGADLYFIDGGNSVLSYDGTTVNQSNIDSYAHNNEWICGFDNVAFYNSGMYVQLNQNIQQSQDYYVYNDTGSGSGANDASLMSYGNTDAQNEWNNRVGDYADVAAAVSDYITKINDGHYNDPAESPARPNNVTYTDFLTSAGISTIVSNNPTGATGTPFPANPGSSLPAGTKTYVLGADGGATQFNIGNGNTCELDLSNGPYVFYVKGDFTFKTGQLVFTHGDITNPNKTAYFIICPGASLRFEPYNVSAGNATGIVSDNCFAAGSTYERKNLVQTSKPAVMVLGAGCDPTAGDHNRCYPEAGQTHVQDGQIYFDGNQNECVLTAYVNLLPNPPAGSTGPYTNYGSVCGNRGGNCMIFYGRLYCNQCYGGNGSCMVMPYCPAPDDAQINGFVGYEHDYLSDGFSYYIT